MASRITIQNSRSTPMTVIVEPWGRDYTLLPEEELTAVAVWPADDFCFRVIPEEHDFLLYAESACDDVVVYQAGVEFPCGHNRQHRPGEV